MIYNNNYDNNNIEGFILLNATYTLGILYLDSPKETQGLLSYL